MNKEELLLGKRGRWWVGDEICGYIKYFEPGFFKFIYPHEDLANCTWRQDGPPGVFKFYNPAGKLVCIESSQSHYADNGPGMGYTFYHHDGREPVIGALEIRDKYDGESDVLYGGPFPSQVWFDRPLGGRQTPDPRKKERTASKEAIRARVPFSKRVGLFYYPGSLEDSGQTTIILAGPSLFAPESLTLYHDANNLLCKEIGTIHALPQNWVILVNRASLKKLEDCIKTHDSDLFWKSKAGYVYPMLFIYPEKSYSWTPRDISSWIPESRLQAFLDSYQYTPGWFDPRIPQKFWPNGRNYHPSGK